MKNSVTGYPPQTARPWNSVRAKHLLCKDKSIFFHFASFFALTLAENTVIETKNTEV